MDLTQKEQAEILAERNRLAELLVDIMQAGIAMHKAHAALIEKCLDFDHRFDAQKDIDLIKAFQKPCQELKSILDKTHS